MIRVTTFIAGLIASISSSAMAQDASQFQQEPPVVVELFTSQSCSSCVPATEFLAELSEKRNVIVLGLHVDYWNTLNTRDGRWKDPYSSAAYTERQRQYNMNIRHRRSVYTPQMVINGTYEAVGSDRGNVLAMIEQSQTQMSPAPIAFETDGSRISFTIDPKDKGEAFLISFKEVVDTDVRGGENAGVHFVDVNVVSNVDRLGSVGGQGATFDVASPKEGYGCALIVQAPDQGRIINAAYCPAL